ncbi:MULTISPECIES: SMP-30/gluconolactonase/LRE family protein [Thermomonosporaceae]|uniref:SMP-30/gluconolactonase/LRE family protein n=1 Tax=Thermomonosporaceae TaxID=2012 RepID=UPI00255A7934|nr:MULTISPECIES: SMP-30/gluconolactonase/LRE family protein [Thermomonosporaceae]MDL4777550.1 SMP-30/gluconolactonase/LRE family protein [Actinomadura xylanilytica]
MSRLLTHPSIAAAVTALATVLPLASAAQAAGAPATAHHATAHRAPTRHAPADRAAGVRSAVRVAPAYELPGERVYPEGIAADPRTGDLYAASYADGTVFKTTPGHRVAEVFLPAGADGRRTANGLKVDRAGRLWVIDSTAGVSVYDASSRRLLAQFTVTGSGETFVNDVAIAPDGAAYLTDSTRAVVYRVTPRDLAKAEADGGRAGLTPRFDLDDAPEPPAPGASGLNGIVADPSGRYLLTADMTGGVLYRLDIHTGAIRKVASKGGDMLNADGLELQHGRLWVVHNVANQISRWKVTANGLVAREEQRVTDKALKLPTTLVRRNGTLYVVRSQFDKGGPMGPGTPETPFTIASVDGI